MTIAAMDLKTRVGSSRHFRWWPLTPILLVLA